MRDLFSMPGGNRQVHHILKSNSERFSERDVRIISDLGRTIHLAARCGLGQTSLNFINSVFDKFGNELMERKEITGG